MPGTFWRYAWVPVEVRDMYVRTAVDKNPHTKVQFLAHSGRVIAGFIPYDWDGTVTDV